MRNLVKLLFQRVVIVSLSLLLRGRDGTLRAVTDEDLAALLAALLA